ncbi:MAG: hypothetical protein ABIG63_14560 [Chloroflexota bacterium]
MKIELCAHPHLQPTSLGEDEIAYPFAPFTLRALCGYPPRGD